MSILMKKIRIIGICKNSYRSINSNIKDMNSLVSKLQIILGSNSKILTANDDDFKNYNTDWTKQYEG